MLKLVVVIVIPLPIREERHDETVPRTAATRVRTVSDTVAKTVDEESALLNQEHPKRSHQQETTQGTHPATGEVTNDRRKKKTHDTRDRLVVFVLPHHHLVLAKIGHVIERRLRIDLKENPSHVRPKEAIVDVIRVVVVVDMLVVTTMVGAPVESGVLKSTGTENERKETHRPLRLEREV